MKTIIRGEKRYISIRLSQKAGRFGISGATYEIRLEDRETIFDTGECGVEDNTVWMLFDSTQHEVGDTLYVYFWVKITDTQKLVNGIVRVEIAR